MECVSCGASVEITNDLEKFVKCGYCGTSNANFKSFENITSIKNNYSEEDIDSELLDGIVYNLQHHDYKEVHNLALKYKNKKPNSWIALTYLALSEFWLGANDFTHLSNVFLNLNKAQEISDNNELVLDAFEKIINDTAVIASKNKHYGPELEASLTAFELILKKNLLSEESHKLFIDYLHKAVGFMKEEASAALKKDKDNFDTKSSRIQSLYRISLIQQDIETTAFCYFILEIHVRRNQSKSYIKSIEQSSQELKLILEEAEFDIKGDALKNLTKLLTGKSGCFIATAALGSSDHEVIKELRLFRDTRLLKTFSGKVFIWCYYLISPFFASIIRKSKILRKLTRVFVVTPAHKWALRKLNLKL
jgi:hypothetical protein